MSESKELSLSAFSLKVIAILCMTLDHTVVLWSAYMDPLTVSCLRAIGRLTFPIMVFLLIEGYHYTSNRINYAGRLFVFAIISMAPFYMMEGKPWNVMFTLFTGLMLLIAKDEAVRKFDGVDERVWTVLFLLVSGAASWFLKEFDWGFTGILVIYIAGQIKDRRLRALLIAVLLFAGYMTKSGALSALSLIFYSGLFISPVPLLLYNGERGRSYGKISKYAFYIYYPAHIFVLCMIYLAFSYSL